MKVDQISMTFWAIFVPVVLIAATAVGHFFMKWIWLPRIQRIAENAGGIAQRKDGSNHKRQTDIEENLTRIDLEKRQMAEAMIKRGEFVEAAGLLESIKFQRRAIDILEKNGYLVEAAHVLVRLGVPNRAAILLERNQAFEPAAEFFTQANMHEKAGDAYMKLVDKEYNYFEKAADSYEAARAIDKMLECFAVLLRTDRIVYFCLEEKKYTFLARYLADPMNALVAFQMMTDVQIAQFIDSCNLLPQTSQAFINWVNLVCAPEVTSRVVARIVEDERSVDHFWKTISPVVRQKTIDQLIAQKETSGTDLITIHGDSLRRTGDYKNATELYRISLNYRGIALTLIDGGHLAMLAQWCTQIKKPEIGDKVTSVMGGNTQGPWDDGMKEQARTIVEALPGPPDRRPKELQDNMPDKGVTFDLSQAEPAQNAEPQDVTKKAS